MNCQVCNRTLWGASYIVTFISPTGHSLTANIDRECMVGLIGLSGHRALSLALAKSGWVQEPLPEPSPAS